MPVRFAFAGLKPAAVAWYVATLLLALSLYSGSPAHAEDPVADAQKVISSQITALKDGDASAAYAFASPGIRSLFPDESRFFDMVRTRYEALSRAERYAFGRSKLVGGGEIVLQEVTGSGRDAKDWTAIYDMRLQDDGSYKVNGVRMLAKATSTGI